MKNLVIIAALEREIAPLVEGWAASTVKSQNRQVSLFTSESAIVACAGIGVVNARIAAGAAYEAAHGDVARFISVGLAGALIPELRVGEIFIPSVVVDDVDGGKIETHDGSGVLVTASSIAGVEAKRAMGKRHLARAVDMEAYAVGDVARVYKTPFMAIKAISDDLDFPMPPLSRFVGEAGEFHTLQFAVFAVLRPWLWPAVMALGRNSAQATQQLAAHLRQVIQQHQAGLYNGIEPFSQVKG